MIAGNKWYMKKRTDKQVEVIVFRREAGGIRYLMLLRNAEKGGFWQPITGNVEEGEAYEQAARRELSEETGVHDFICLFDTGYSFEFFDNDLQQFERVFAVEVGPDTEIILSDEHTDMRWASKEECLGTYLKYPGNKAGLEVLARSLGE